MFNVFLVALGGAVGASMRHVLSGAALRWAGPAWPWGTLIVNVSGSLLIGVLAGWLAFRGEGGTHWRLLLGTGVLGGFTTFSAYSLETALMIERREYVAAAAYSLGSVAVGLAAVFVGLWVARRVFA
jgi:fluoride exporter